MSKVIDLKTRRYDAASRTTRTSNWLTPSTDANAAIKDPQLIRNRARDLVRNNPWAAKGLSVIVNNVVGYGIRAQWGSTSKRNAKRAQDLWAKWAETTQCDAQGLTDFYGIQQTFMRAIVQDGECLLRLRPRRPEDNLVVPFQLQVLEADFLYEFNDGPTQTGGYIQRGIEYDAIGRRIAYYLYKFHPGAQGRFAGAYGSAYSRVDAKEVIHGFRVDRPGQERGVTWFAPVVIRFREFDIFEDAFLNRQKLANLFAAFLYTDEPDDTEELSDVSELTPGSIYILKSGRRLEMTLPPPAADYDPYTSSVLKGVAAGLGITYEALTGDLSEVNFSSARMGWQEFGRSIDSWRWQMLIPTLCHGVARWFIDFSGIPDLTHAWTPPARTMIDPAREVPAIRDSIRSGLTTQPEAMRAQGYDPRQMVDEIAEFNQLLDEKGVVLDTDPRRVSKQGQGQGESLPTGLNNATDKTDS
jgi:lambda family phage portal protein